VRSGGREGGDGDVVDRLVEELVRGCIYDYEW
jgi:hypothetical protein